jgi:hypothetical protein
MRTSISEQENESHRDVRPCAPEKVGGLFVVLSEMSGEGEILLSGIGLWSSAITRLTGCLTCVISEMIKNLHYRPPAQRIVDQKADFPNEPFYSGAPQCSW